MHAQSTIDTRLRPFQAAAAVRRLLRNPDDTDQVFLILRAMRGRSGFKILRRFQASATGAAVLAERRQLLHTLQDRPGLAALPEGSLGRAYLTFMLQEDLTADGLVASSETEATEGLGPDARLFRERMRDMHDLTHVLTGYGRDPLGELCLLAFMFSHTRNLGAAMIVLMGMAKSLREPNSKRVRRAIAQGWRSGGKARWLPEQDWEALLAQPLDAVRRQIGVAAPTHYLEMAS